MDIVAEDKKLSRLTNPGPDDQLREILKGSDFEDYNTTTPLNSENLVYYPEIRSTKSEIRNNIECSKAEFSEQKRLRKLKTCFEFW